MVRLSSRIAISCFALVAVMTTFVSARCEEIATGGLDASQTEFTVGPNLLVNGDLANGAQGWTFNPSCFSIDGTGANASLRLQEPCAQQFPAALNELKCPPGMYTISAEIKTQSSIT